MKFTLEIQLGNEEMQTPFDVGVALSSLGRNLQYEDEFSGFAGRILDANGNTVGYYEVV